VLVVLAVGIYNRLVRARVRVDEAWAQIDTQLQRRHDLIPNLVETVKGYAAHERATFEEVTSARAKAISVSAPAELAEAENGLTQALGKLLAITENYPDLKADANFRQLQDELAHTENMVAGSRGTTTRRSAPTTSSGRSSRRRSSPRRSASPAASTSRSRRSRSAGRRT
jgi:LemA protein